MVVLPVPGPPETMHSRLSNAVAAAIFCQSGPHPALPREEPRQERRGHRRRAGEGRGSVHLVESRGQAPLVIEIAIEIEAGPAHEDQRPEVVRIARVRDDGAPCELLEPRLQRGP